MSMVDYMGLTRCRHVVDLDAEAFIICISTATTSTPMEGVSQGKVKELEEMLCGCVLKS